MPERNPQTIVRLTAENIKRIKAVEVKPDGSLIVIGGANMQGKTSLLDAIEMGLAGGRSIPPVPIRRGQRKARIVVELQDYIVERTFTQKGTALIVKGKDGSVFPSPQKLLDSLVGDLTFDPLRFDRLKPAEQMELVKKLDPTLDFTALDTERQLCFEARKDAKRDSKKVTTLLDAMPDGIAAWSREAPSVTELADVLQAARTKNTANEQKREALIAFREARKELATEIRSKEADLAAEKKRAAKMDADGIEKRAEVDALEDTDAEAIRLKLGNAEAEADKARQAREHDAQSLRLDKLSETEVENSERIEAIDEEKRAAVSAANLPIAGLGFGDDCVLLHDLPLEQASGAERLRVSFAISRVLSGDLKIALSRDGSLLDTDSLAAVAKLCDESGCQFWLERVGDGDEVSVVIEDGVAISGGEG